MYSQSVLDPMSPWMKSNPAFFLIVTAEVHDNTVLGSRSPDRDPEDGDREVKEEEQHSGDGGGRGGERGRSIQETREKDLTEDHIIHSGARLVGGNTRPVDGEDDGFKTPVTAGHHKIDSASECPAAPKKPKPVARRKRIELPGDGGDSNAGISLVFHLSDEEVVAMFPEILPVRKKIKKARRDDNHDD